MCSILLKGSQEILLKKLKLMKMSTRVYLKKWFTSWMTFQCQETAGDFSLKIPLFIISIDHLQPKKLINFIKCEKSQATKKLIIFNTTSYPINTHVYILVLCFFNCRRHFIYWTCYLPVLVARTKSVVCMCIFVWMWILD